MPFTNESVYLQKWNTDLANDRIHQTSRYRGKHQRGKVAHTDYANLGLRGVQGERLLLVGRCTRNADGSACVRCSFLSPGRSRLGCRTPVDRPPCCVLGICLSITAGAGFLAAACPIGHKRGFGRLRVFGPAYTLLYIAPFVPQATGGAFCLYSHPINPVFP